MKLKESLELCETVRGNWEEREVTGMGVQGLFSLMEEHSGVYREVKLRGRRLLIDGSNLLHLLYSSSGLDENLGGEYAAFEDLIENFVSALKMCNISPFVILDGGEDVSGKKEETSNQRAADRIRRSHSAAVEGLRRGILPPLAKKLFKQTMARLNVPLAQTYAEADPQIAALAAEWKCPVLSEDSDFFIFDLPGGLLPIRHFQWRERKDPQKFIRCRSYNSSSFCIHFGLSRRLLPAFAALAGNDYSKLRGLRSTKGGPRRLEELLQWLKDFQQPEEALKAWLSKLEVGSEEQQVMMGLLSASMKAYELPDSAVKEFFDSRQAPPPQNGAALIPEWLHLPLMSGRMTATVLDVLLLQKNKLCVMVDDCSLPSANNTSRPLRQLFYGLLLDGPTAPPVEERDRQGWELSFLPVNPTINHSSDGLKLRSLHQTEQSRRLQVLLEGLGVTEESLRELPSHQRLPVAVTCYWMERAEPPPQEELLRALLGGFMGLEHEDQPPQKQKLTPDVGVAHSLGQWQACLRDALQLNQLLGFPLEEPRIARLYQGTFIQSLLHQENTLHQENQQLYHFLFSAARETLRPGGTRRSPPVVHVPLKLEEEEAEDECWLRSQQEVLVEEQPVGKNRYKSRKKKQGSHF